MSNTARIGGICVVAVVVVAVLTIVGFGEPEQVASQDSTEGGLLINSDPTRENNGTIRGKFLSLSEYSDLHFNNLDNPDDEWVNWPERGSGGDGQCANPGPDGQQWKTLPWLPQSPPAWLDRYGLTEQDFENRTEPTVGGDAANGDFLNLSGDCQSAPTDGGTMSTPERELGQGAWLNPSAFRGWTSPAGGASFSESEAYKVSGPRIPGTTNECEANPDPRSVDTDQFSKCPRMWATPNRDTTNHANHMFDNNGYENFDPGEFTLSSSGVSLFRHRFNINEEQYEQLANDENVDLAFRSIADDWIRLYINGYYIDSTTSAVDDSLQIWNIDKRDDEGRLILNKDQPNVLAIQAMDKAAWHKGGGSAEAPNAASIWYRFNIRGLKEGEIRGDKRAIGNGAEQSVADDQEVTVEDEGSTTENPFEFSPVPTGEHAVSTTVPSGYTVSYTTCTGNDTCHDRDNREQGASVDVDVPEDSFVHVRFYYERQEEEEVTAEPIIYGANHVDIKGDQFRDNEKFEIGIRTYLWPDAGMRDEGGFFGAPTQDRFWLAGIWGDDANDWRGAGNRKTDPNEMTRFNTEAEAECPGDDCLQRIPMAYVPHNDGSDDNGEPYPGRQDGSTTPNGNNWRQIREESLGSNSGREVRSCGNYTNRYNTHCGGIASYLNRFEGGERGNHIKNVEVSNIRVRGNNPEAVLEENAFHLQGRVDNTLLQPNAQEDINLPPGSQGPDSNPAWDNIRKPGTGLLQGNSNVANSLLFSNNNGNPPNFTDNPENISRNEYSDRSLQYGEVDPAVTLLQDGKDDANPPYPNKNEPITYTAQLEQVERVDLVWDEYVEWSQVDDKGHWYTEKTRRATGVDRGNPDTNDTARLEDPDRGTPRQNDHQVCADFDYGDQDGDGDNEWYCSEYEWHDEHCDYESYRDDVRYRYNSRTYYDDRTRSRYGWHNTQTTERSMPYGKNGHTSRSAFYFDYSNQPSWSRFGVTNYWQDTDLTSMDNAGSTVKPSHGDPGRWIYDESDPAYTSRHIYSDPDRTPRYKTDWYYDYDSVCMYDNGSFDDYTEDVDTHYHNAKYVYEDTNSWQIDGHVYGKYGNDATFDGESDGQVDYDWEWQENYQRVSYEQTYTDHYRRLGPRFHDASDKDGSHIYRLRGVEGHSSSRASRDTATIWNPTIQTAEGDVFSGGNLHSYFQNSQTNSAFLFSNNEINNFSGANTQYEQYYIHDRQNAVDAYYPASGHPGTGNPANYVFRDLSDLEQRAVKRSGGSTINGGSLEANDSSAIRDNVRHIQGDATVSSGGVRFEDTAGTYIVDGNLYINGNITYGSSGSERESVPSVGFIVKGNIVIDPSVTTINGSFFSNEQIYTGSVLLNVNSVTNQEVDWRPNNNRTANDQPLRVNGLMVARSYVLARQLSGSGNRTGSAEQFHYSGRVVINPPPGFSRVYTSDAVWNDTVPRN